jgi:raffinose/stachyose/melibiose transport system permease protein
VSRRGSGATVVSHAVLGVGTVLTVLPLLVVAVTALLPAGQAVDGVELPHALRLATFWSAWRDGGFADAFRTSGIIAVAVVLVVTVLAVVAGYALAVYPFRGSRVILYVFMSGIVAPYIALVLPMYFQFQSLDLLGSYWSLIIAESGLYLGFGVFWMYSAFSGLPTSLTEAARIDGAGSVRILWSVLLPVLKPSVVTLMMLTFLSSWNEYLVPLVLGGQGALQTVSLGLSSFQGQHLTDVPSLAAGSLLVAAPAVGVYLLTQRTFFHGLLEGASKG